MSHRFVVAHSHSRGSRYIFNSKSITSDFGVETHTGKFFPVLHRLKNESPFAF